MTPEELGAEYAFPQSLVSHRDAIYDSGDKYVGGMNLRTWVAAMAMQGLLANPAPGLAQDGCNSLAVMAVHAADALLEELARAAK